MQALQRVTTAVRQPPESTTCIRELSETSNLYPNLNYGVRKLPLFDAIIYYIHCYLFLGSATDIVGVLSITAQIKSKHFKLWLLCF